MGCRNYKIFLLNYTGFSLGFLSDLIIWTLYSALIIGSWKILRRGNFYTFYIIITLNSNIIVITLNGNFIDVYEISLTTKA
jgi:hypothetical protein